MDKNGVVVRCSVSNDSQAETASRRVFGRTRNCLQVLEKEEFNFQSSNRDVELSLLTIIPLDVRMHTLPVLEREGERARPNE